ncbi:hypothetical protein GQ53DRAFT_696433 [Thozetella sp. PMI_491]|nr:hypothetical protein GQ53DRAFT_696433 [Thozetella sp. PMI_491]
MQSFRRAALSATLTATRAVTPKPQASSIVAQLARSSAPKTVSILASRPFSQSARVASGQDSEGSGLAGEPLRAPRFHHKDNETEFGVFVRNISFDTTDADLSDIFGKYGEVAHATVARDPRGISRGYGFVYYNNAEDRTDALAEVDGSFFHGRRLACVPRVSRVGNRQKSSRGQKKPTECLFIGNIPYETTDVEFNRLFEGLANLSDVRVAIDRTTGWPRGFAHADFTDVASAEKAKERLAGAELGGRELRIDFAEGPKKNNNRPSQLEQSAPTSDAPESA